MAEITPSKIALNFVPGLSVGPGDQLGGQDRLDGRYLSDLSIFNRSFANTVNIDKAFVAGQNVNAGQTCGMWGRITQTEVGILAVQATHVDEENPTTNNDGAVLNLAHTGDGRSHNILISFDSMPVIPSATGLSIVIIEVRFSLWEEANGANNDANPGIHPNSASFDETAVVWNDKPANTSNIQNMPPYSSANAYITGGYVVIDSTQYNNIRDNGITLDDVAGNFYLTAEYSDDNGNNTANKPKIDVRFTYEIQDDKIYLASGLLKKYADAFRGFAQNSVIKGGTIKVRINGIDSNQSNLTKHANYQLSDTPGEIQTGTSATSDKVVCNAINDTEVQINYGLDDAT